MNESTWHRRGRVAAAQLQFKEVGLPTVDFGALSINDAMKALLGEQIGEGQYRDVFASGINEHSVIKFERNTGQFANATEWMIWNELEGTRFKKWLAPCFHISHCGIWLWQAKCEPLAKRDRPKQVPSFLSDIKTENWGWYKDRPVCMDYSNHKLFTMLARNGRMVRAKWWR